MSTYNIQLHDEIRISLNICFLELSESAQKRFRISRGKQDVGVRAIVQLYSYTKYSDTSSPNHTSKK